VAAAAITMCTDVALWFRPDGPLDAGGVADVFVGLILGGIRR
jgi:tetracycline repressor-like protein